MPSLFGGGGKSNKKASLPIRSTSAPLWFESLLSTPIENKREAVGDIGGRKAKGPGDGIGSSHNDGMMSASEIDSFRAMLKKGGEMTKSNLKETPAREKRDAGGGKFNPYTNKLQKIVQKGHPSWKRAKFESYGGCGNSNCVRMSCAAHRRHCKLQEKRFSIWQSLNDSRNYWQRPVLRKRCRASS